MGRALSLVLLAAVAGGVPTAVAAPAAAVVRFQGTYATQEECTNAVAEAGQAGYPAFCQPANQIPGFNLFVDDWQ
ncbi:hypothetical protein ACFO4E_20350 [Nocardiopsis mangrovi]|uniref:Uncharacterized protein n=1 Tax=Nocardiopsis mangrovi TaxID=1179818 RepID=A0ABV9E0V4_9ACTN